MKGLIWAAAAGLGGWLLWGNRSIVTTTAAVPCPGLPPAFHGFRIAHITDWHNASFTKALGEAVRRGRPDIICITGDMLDARRTDIPKALETARVLADIAPCYYVMGNHEARIDVYPTGCGYPRGGTPIFCENGSTFC